MDTGPPNRMSMVPSMTKSNEFPRQTSSFDEYQSSDHKSAKKNGRPTLHEQRGTIKPKDKEEFARCRLSSKGSDSTSDDEGADNEDPKRKRRFPELFRGTG